MARWNDLAPWVGPTINEGDGDNRPLEPEDRLTEVRGLVLHIASGFFEGTISWQRNASADVSSHFIGGRAGQRAQMVDTADRSWAQRAGNGTWLSVELEGFAPDDPLHASHPGWERLTDAQIEFCAQLLARAHVVHGVPLQLASSPAGRGLGHHSMGAESGYDWGHSQCPGVAIKSQKPAILARAIQIAGGAAPSAPIANTGDDDDMQTLMRYEGDPAVFLTDGREARWIQTPGEIADLGTLAAVGRLNIAPGGVQVVGRRELIGVIIGPCPRGWEAQAQQPGAAPMSDAQLDVLAGKVATKLSALRFVPTV